MKVFVCPKASVRSGDVSGLLSDASAKYDCDVDGSIKFTQSQTLLDQDAQVELKLPVAGLTKAVSSGKVDTSNLRGAELSVKFPAEDIKLSADVEALLSANSAPDAFKVEAGRKAEVGGRNVDLKGKYASKGHAVTLEATTRLDANTKLHASYGVRSKVLKGKLSYTYDLTTLDATHNFSDNSTQLDITRKLEGNDTLKLTTFSGSKEASLTYKHDPFKVVLNVPSAADKVSGSVVFEREYLW